MMKSISTISTGIITLLTFSIPFLTPSRTIIAVAAMKIANQRRGSNGFEIKEPKYSPLAILFISPVMKPKAYLITHPPITE